MWAIDILGCVGTHNERETEETKKRKIRLWMAGIMRIPIVVAMAAIWYVITAVRMMYYAD